MNKSKTFVIVLIAVVVVACGLAIYFYHAWSVTQANTPAAQAAAVQAQVQAIVSKVGQLIILPTGETPTIATVVNPDLLKNQPFFANAVKGDLVLMYTSAKKAILYDPNLNKIVEVAPITIGSPAPVASTAPTATSTAASSKK